MSIDLTRSDEEIWVGTRRRFRSYINAAERAGRRASMDDGWVHAAAFVKMYAATMHRVGARAEYLFGTDYVRGLRAALGDRLHLCVVDVDGTIAAPACSPKRAASSSTTCPAPTPPSNGIGRRC